MAKNNISPDKLEHLALKAQAGNTKAFTELFELLTRSLFRFVYSRVRRRSDTEDIIAETWKTFWLKLPKYKPKNVKGYLFQIAYTKTIDFFRTRKQTQPLKDYQQIDKRDGPETQAIKNNQKMTLRKKVRLLPQPYQDIVWLRFIEDLSIKETATTLKRTGLSIRVIQHRAIKKLRELLDD